MDCVCSLKYKWKPRSKLKLYLEEKRIWSVNRGEKFTINSFMYPLLVYMYKNKLFNRKGHIECKELLSILRSNGAPVLGHLFFIRELVKLHLVGQHGDAQHFVPLYCLRKHKEDLDVMNVYMVSLCDNWVELPRRIGITSIMLKNYIEFNRISLFMPLPE